MQNWQIFATCLLSTLGSAGFGCGGVSEETRPDAGTRPDAEAAADAPPAEKVTLTVSAGRGGTVSTTPGEIRCDGEGPECVATFEIGAQVTLTAAPETDHGFDHWLGDCAGSARSTQITMDGDRSCTANFLGTAGAAAVTAPPSSVVPNTTEDDDTFRLFVEQIDLTLSEAIPFDVHVPDTYTQFVDPTARVPAGTRVDVYFLHFDPVGDEGSNGRRTAAVTFPSPIVGLAVEGATLAAGDPLVGRDDVVYPVPAMTSRGLEQNGQDPYTFSGDRRTLSLDLLSGTAADQVRVITLAEGETMPQLRSDTLSAVAPPGDVSADATESDDFWLLYDEANPTLSGDLDVDETQTGTYAGSATQLGGGQVASGTSVRSVMLHFDPTGTELTLEASVTFQRDILGIIVRNELLDETDPLLGASGTTYPEAGADGARGLELGSNDLIRIAGDRRSLRLRGFATGADQVRVLLAE